MKFGFLGVAAIGCIMAASISVASATPIGTVETFSTSVGTQPSNVGVITLTQISANSVQIFVDLNSVANPNYGFLNTGGPHTPFAFQLSVSGGLSISSWATPGSGVGPNGTFTLNTSGGSATPYGDYNTALSYSGGNGTSHDYVGDLKFTLSRTGGLDLTNFISNGTAYFAADLSNGASSTGSQAWKSFTTTPPVTTRDIPVPEPLTLSLFSAGLLGAGAVRRKKSRKV